MKNSQKILMIAGLLLTILGMAYGFWYAVADEHPTLERMGVSLASAFAEAAKGDMSQAQQWLADYGVTRFEYIRDVHTHSHLAALSTLLLVLGLCFRQLSFSERTRRLLAYALVLGAVSLPLGSFIEMFISGLAPTAISALGALALIAGLGIGAMGVLSPPKSHSQD